MIKTPTLRRAELQWRRPPELNLLGSERVRYQQLCSLPPSTRDNFVEAAAHRGKAAAARDNIVEAAAGSSSVNPATVDHEDVVIGEQRQNSGTEDVNVIRSRSSQGHAQGGRDIDALLEGYGYRAWRLLERERRSAGATR